MYNTEVVDPAPTSWGAVFDDAGTYTGKVTAYDSPIYIADAALYLMETQPDLGIEDPYALDADQLAAAVDLLKSQREHVGEYWSDYLKEIQAFGSGDSVIGTTWQVIVNVAQGEKTPVEAILPEEGATGWSDTWMISAVRVRVPPVRNAVRRRPGRPVGRRGRDEHGTRARAARPGLARASLVHPHGDMALSSADDPRR